MSDGADGADRADVAGGFPDHASQKLEILPVPGLPEFRPGDDLTAVLAERMAWLRDGDVVVVTSKVFSKVEGRLVPAPPTTRSATRCVAGWSTRRPSGWWPARAGR